ncbi:unnamed protein product, partial [Amoebophrya sp. A25]
IRERGCKALCSNTSVLEHDVEYKNLALGTCTQAYTGCCGGWEYDIADDQGQLVFHAVYEKPGCCEGERRFSFFAPRTRQEVATVTLYPPGCCDFGSVDLAFNAVMHPLLKAYLTTFAMRMNWFIVMRRRNNEQNTGLLVGVGVGAALKAGDESADEEDEVEV